MIDLVIRDATVIDGTRAPRFAGDIAIRDGRIAAIGRVDEKANREINARGKIAAPGFIDAHTHDDRLMLSSPDMAPKVSQGVTTVVAGNCGISLAPAPKGMRAPVAVPLDLLDDEGGWFRYKTFKEYVDALRSQPAATNCALLVGHSMLRVQTMDSTSRPATREEIKNMRALVLDFNAINETSGFEQGGIIGGDFLKNYCVTIDFARAELRFKPHTSDLND